MQFNSIAFLFFFTVLYLFYWNLPSFFRRPLLILAGAFFYFSFSKLYLIHYLVVILINFFLLKRIEKDSTKLSVTLAVVFNICNLAFFKYFYFLGKVLFQSTGSDMFADLEKKVTVYFPLAVSFYTFQILSHHIDIYRSREREETSLVNYFLYTLYFPVMIAGPILRGKEFFRNIENASPEKEKIYRGTYLLVGGLIKKVLLADSIGPSVSPVYGNPSEYVWWSLLLVGFIFLMQLYFDFSGLADIVRGLSLYLGIEIPLNFKAPFFSRSLSEFWLRWHISLSSWLRDYLYFSLGGSRASALRVYFNVFATMTLGGFWHGADYTFIAWGAYWGIALVLERIIDPNAEEKAGKAGILVSVIRASFVTSVAAVSVLMFRSNSTEQMVELFRGIFTNRENLLLTEMNGAGLGWLVLGLGLVQSEPAFMLNSVKNLESMLYMFFAFLLFHSFEYWPEKLERFRKFEPWLPFALGLITVFLLATLAQDGDGFIYTTF